MGSNDVEAGFAKLQGEDFEYYMQTYSIILGRNSKKSIVDVDLSSLGGGMNISRHHARIFYDFQRRRFALEVLGMNDCFVEGVIHLPGNLPVKLDSHDLLQIGDKEFYFLLPVRSILGGPRNHPTGNHPVVGGGGVGHNQQHLGLPSAPGGGGVGYGNKGKGWSGEYYEYEDHNAEEDGSSGGKMTRRDEGADGGGYWYASSGKVQLDKDKKADGRPRVDREADNQQLLPLEEKDVVSSVATVLSDLCGPGEWTTMDKLHAELVEQFSSIWHHGRVRRYLISEDYSSLEANGKPWYGLLMLLRKYHEHFVINTRSKGQFTQGFVSLVSLPS